MASWLDLVAFALTLATFLGVVFGVIRILNKISEAVHSTKESLKSKGLTVSDKGVSVRTSSRYSREDYLDATQRGLIKAMGASSYAPGGAVDAAAGATDARRPVLARGRHDSRASVHSEGSSGGSGEERTRKRFSLRRAAPHA